MLRLLGTLTFSSVKIQREEHGQVAGHHREEHEQVSGHARVLRHAHVPMHEGPWGRVLAKAEDDENVILAEIDLDLQEEVRKEIPLFEHRRTDIY